MNPIIRNATIDDIEAICQIEREGHNRWSRSQFADELSLKFSNLVVLEDSTGIIGFAVTWNVAGDIQLNNIGIHREHRRQGLGTELMNHIIEHAKGSGATGKIYLEVSAQNTSAHSFYLRNGFVETGTRKNYYDNIDAILMERELLK